jgi:hypothetical protein
MPLPIGVDHWLQPLLVEAVGATLDDWGLQFGTKWTATPLDADEHAGELDLDTPRSWVQVRLGLRGGGMFPFHVWVSDVVPRSIIEGLGFIELPKDGFGAEGLDMLGELANLMAGSMNRVFGERTESVRVTQRVGDIETRIHESRPLAAAIHASASDADCTFSLAASERPVALLRCTMPRAVRDMFARQLSSGLDDRDGFERRQAA